MPKTVNLTPQDPCYDRSSQGSLSIELEEGLEFMYMRVGNAAAPMPHGGKSRDGPGYVLASTHRK